MSWGRRALLAALVGAALAAPAASGASATVYVTSRGVTYPGATHELTVPWLTLPQGTALVFMNLHLWSHNITSDAWISHDRRLFRSELVSFGEQALVEGVDALAPGTYGFFCRNHLSMRGSITIV